MVIEEVHTNSFGLCILVSRPEFIITSMANNEVDKSCSRKTL